MTLQDKIRGTLAGGALGDALGWPIEFESTESILLSQGRQPPPHLADGDFTDDTQMTLFTAEGLIRAHQRFKAKGIVSVRSVVRNAYLRWLATQQDTFVAPDGFGSRLVTLLNPSKTKMDGWLAQEKRLHRRMAPGTTCIGGLVRSKHENKVFSPEDPPNDSKGCGAVMRMAPVGILIKDSRAAWGFGKDLGALTHGHPDAYLPAAYLAVLIQQILYKGKDLRGAMNRADVILCDVKEKAVGDFKDVLDKVETLAEQGKPTVRAIESIGGAWEGHEALGIALLCVLTADLSTPEGIKDALWRSVLHSGDSDSTGSITGNLIGVLVGYEALPQDWLSEVKGLDIVLRMADDLTQVVLGEDVSEVDYPPN